MFYVYCIQCVSGLSCLGSDRPRCLDVPHHAAECSSGLEQRAGALPASLSFFFFLPLFASGTQLPHLTFSIWPLPRGEIARVSKRGRHTSWILLSFNLHSPFSPWWCTWIRNEDIAQLRGFLRCSWGIAVIFVPSWGFDVSWIWILGSSHLCDALTSP